MDFSGVLPYIYCHTEKDNIMTGFFKTGFLTLAAILMAFGSAFAQDLGFNNALQTINKVNSYRPEKSPKHQGSQDILKDRILDSRNRVVGNVNDVILSRNGSIKLIDADFDRLKLGTDQLIINYDDFSIRPVSNGYKMSYTDDQIEEVFPELLANIATASGEGSETAFSLKKIVGADVKAKDGRKLGKVQDVLFDSLGGRAELIFVAMDYKSARGEGAAIPFNVAKYDTDYKSVIATVPNDMADAMIQYAKDK